MNSLHKTVLCIVLPLLCLCLFPCAASAHRLNVFAWLENGKVAVECNFGKKSPARNATIRILSGDGQKILAEGKTDEKGLCLFPIPSQTIDGLLIQADAGEGHQNEWRMDASEFGAQTSPVPSAIPAAPLPADAPKISAPTAGNAISPGQVQAIVHSEMERQLAPIRRQLARMTDSGPGLRDIIGGIGWILGLGGMYLFGRTRHGASSAG